MQLKPFTFHSPQSLNEVLDLVNKLQDKKILAGGTFLLNNLRLLKKRGIKTPQNIISLRKVEKLHGISLEKNKLIIKAMTTLCELCESPDLKHNFQILKIVAKGIATTPIRNMATIGGNLTCRYAWTEMPTVMIALEATMHFIDETGKEESILAEQFFKNGAKSNKLFSHVSIPLQKQANLTYQRISKQSPVDIPLLAICAKSQNASKHFSLTRIAVNSGVNFAQRDFILEEFLNKSKLSKSIDEEALNHLDNKIYDARSDEYKQHMFKICIKNAIRELAL